MILESELTAHRKSENDELKKETESLKGPSTRVCLKNIVPYYVEVLTCCSPDRKSMGFPKPLARPYIRRANDPLKSKSRTANYIRMLISATARSIGGYTINTRLYSPRRQRRRILLHWLKERLPTCKRWVSDTGHTTLTPTKGLFNTSQTHSPTKKRWI